MNVPVAQAIVLWQVPPASLVLHSNGHPADIMEDNLHGAIMIAKSSWQELILSQEGFGATIAKIVNSFRAYIQLLNGSLSANDKLYKSAQKVKDIMDKLIKTVKILFL